MRAEFRAAQNALPFRCAVPLLPDQTATIVASWTVAEFWRDLRDARDHSLYFGDDCAGIVVRKMDSTGSSDNGKLVPIGSYYSEKEGSLFPE